MCKQFCKGSPHNQSKFGHKHHLCTMSCDPPLPTQVLEFVRDVMGTSVSIKLRLNPRADLSDMPLKSFYR